MELVRLQRWITTEGLKVVVIFEGRDAAGKGGTIRRITESLNPRICRVVALGIPTEREKSVVLPALRGAPARGGRNGAVRPQLVQPRRSGEGDGVCTDAEYNEFLRACPEFERMLVRSGIQLIKYWFSVSAEEQERRLRQRIEDPVRRWKISPMDVQSRELWEEYSKAKDEMFAFTDIKQAPWYVVPSDDKKKARLNCIAHLLSQIPYEKVKVEKLTLPDLPKRQTYVRAPMEDQTIIPRVW